MTKTIIRRVRLDLPKNLPAPYADMLTKLPYRNWLKAHAAEIASLTDGKGGALVSAVKPRTGKTRAGVAFVTDFEFIAPEKFDYYNTHFLAKMRSRIEENYPGATAQGSPFTYSIATQNDQPKFDALLDGIENMESL